jgi:hypothetical protein
MKEQIADFWYDHPLWIRRFLGDHHWLYIPIHMAVVAFSMTMIPAATVVVGDIAAMAGTIGYLLYTVSVMLLFLAVYLMLALPIRVCDDGLEGYFCMIMTFPLMWWFL